MVTQEQVREALRNVLDPEIGKPIEDLGMLKDIQVSPDGDVRVEVLLTVAGCPLKDRINADVTQALASPTSRAGLLEIAGRSDPLMRDALETVLGRGNFSKPLPDGSPAGPPAGSAPPPIETDPAIVTGLIERTEASIAALQRDIQTLSGPALLDYILADIAELKRILFDPLSSQAIMAGAAGYVLKQIEATSLVSGVRLVASGHTLFDPEAAAKVVHNVEERRRMHEVVAELTPQQRRILVLLAEGISNREIADRLVLAEKTVKNHITGLLAKLGVSHRTQAALMASQLLEDGVVPRPAPPGDNARQPQGAPKATGSNGGPLPPHPRGQAPTQAPGRSR